YWFKPIFITFPLSTITLFVFIAYHMIDRGVFQGFEFFFILLMNYMGLATLLNKTDVIISSTKIWTKTHPLPFWFSKKYDISEIEQLYTTEVGNSYGVVMIFKDYTEEDLVGVDSKEEGLYIEREIEKIIGLEDKYCVGQV
ncbi:MAG: hypothetical protein AB3N14_14780, partial [Flavobacteriaceae bacterium]